MKKLDIDFSKNDGLVPVIIQDHTTDKVLMLGYMNEEAYEKTRNSKLVTFYSRSSNDCGLREKKAEMYWNGLL